MKRCLLLSFAVAAFLFGCGSDSEGNGSNRAVTFRVSGTANEVDVTYTSAQGTSQLDDRSVPWTRTARGFERGDFVFLSAQNQGQTGSVIVTIEWGDDVVGTARSSGAFVIASTDGVLGR